MAIFLPTFHKFLPPVILIQLFGPPCVL